MYRDDEDELLELDRDKLDPIQVDGIGEEDDLSASENEEEDWLTCEECDQEFPEDEIYLAESGLVFCSGQCFEDHENKSRIPIDK